MLDSSPSASSYATLFGFACRGGELVALVPDLWRDVTGSCAVWLDLVDGENRALVMGCGELGRCRVAKFLE